MGVWKEAVVAQVALYTAGSYDVGCLEHIASRDIKLGLGLRPAKPHGLAQAPALKRCVTGHTARQFSSASFFSSFQFVMSFSSPRQHRQSSLPPSSAPEPPSEDINTRSRTGTPAASGTPRRPDALDLDDDGGNEEEDGNAAGSKRRKRINGDARRDVPLVRDAVGESVAESFETFLKT